MDELLLANCWPWPCRDSVVAREVMREVGSVNVEVMRKVVKVMRVVKVM